MLYITKRVIDIIRAELSMFKDVETGGVFLGIHKPNSDTIIVESTFSGPNAIHQRQRYESDEQYINYQISMLSLLYDNPSVIGYWHSHIVFSSFSVEDQKTNEKYAALNQFGSYCGLIQCSKDNELEMFYINGNKSTKCDYYVIDDYNQ